MTDTTFSSKDLAGSLKAAMIKGLDSADQPETETEEEEELEDETEAEDSQELPEGSQETETDEEQESESEEEEEAEDDAEPGRTFALKVFQEKLDFDVDADPEETVRVLQKGLAFDRKTGMQTLVARGEIDWDEAREDYVISEQTRTKLGQAGAVQLLQQFEQAGLPVRNAAGQYDVSELLSLVEKAQNGSTPSEDEKSSENAVQAAREAYEANPTMDTLDAWVDAKADAKAAARVTGALSGRDAKRAEQTKAKARQDALEQQITTAQEYARKEADRLYKKHFKDSSGELDEVLYQQTLDYADMIIRSQHDLTKAREHIKNVAQTLKKRAKGRTQKRKTVKKTKKTVKPGKKPSTAAKSGGAQSSPSTGSRGGRGRLTLEQRLAKKMRESLQG